MRNESLCLGWLQFLFIDDALQVGGTLFGHILVPVFHHIVAVRRGHPLDELLNQVLLVAEVGAGGYGFLYLHHHFLVLAVALVIFGHQGKDVLNAYLHLLHQLDFEHHIIVHLFLLAARLMFEFIAQVDVPRSIVLYLIVVQCQLHFGKLVERGQQVPQLQQGTEQPHKLFLFFQGANLPDGVKAELLQQDFFDFLVAQLMHTLLILISVVIILKRAHGYQAAGILVAEEGKAILHLLFEVAEAYHIAAIFHGIQDAVGAAESLQQAMHLQVLVHPKGIQGLGIEAGQEHAYHDEDVYFLVLHAQGNVLVVVGKALGIHTVGSAESLVIIVDGTCQKLLAHFVQAVSAFRVFVFQCTDTVTFCLIGRIGKYRSDA